MRRSEPESPDFFRRLGLRKDAADADVKRAYRKLSLKHHPDKGGREESFKKIAEAFGALETRRKRELYKEFGKEGPEAVEAYWDRPEALARVVAPFVGERGGAKAIAERLRADEGFRTSAIKALLQKQRAERRPSAPPRRSRSRPVGTVESVPGGYRWEIPFPGGLERGAVRSGPGWRSVSTQRFETWA